MNAESLYFILGSGLASTLLLFPIAYIAISKQFSFKFSNLKILLYFCISVPLVGILQSAFGGGNTDSLSGWFILFGAPLIICLLVIYAAHRLSIARTDHQWEPKTNPDRPSKKINSDKPQKQKNVLENSPTQSLLHTPFRRTSFLVAIVGVFFFAFGFYWWLEKPENTLVRRTAYIPDYPVQVPDPQNHIIQIHRQCQWTNKLPRSGEQHLYERDGSIIAHDNLLSLDDQCIQEKLSNYQSIDSTIEKKIRFAVKFAVESDQLLMREAFESIRWPDKWIPRSGLEIYKSQSIDVLAKAGITKAIAEVIIPACIKQQSRYCIESSREVRSYVWRNFQSSWTMITGIALLILGLAGSLFLTPLTRLWDITGKRVFNWIRSGTL